MALHVLRLSRACAGRGILAQGQYFAAPSASHRETKLPLASSIGVQTRSLQLPSWAGWLWPFGGSDVPTPPAVADAVELEPVVEPLEIVTGFSTDGAFVPVTANISDLSPVVQWTNDALAPSLQSLGLGSYWTPAGWIQHLFTYLTADHGLPVLGSLFCIILLLRIPSVPFYVMGQKNAPALEEDVKRQKQLRQDVEFYRSTGRYGEAQVANQQANKLMAKSALSMLPLFAQFPVMFLFYGLRRMCFADYALIANTKLLWLQTLTIPDPYFLLPVMASSAIFGLIYTNAEAGAAQLKESSGRAVLYSGICVSGVFFCFQPAASVLVLTLNSCVTFSINMTLKIPAVRSSLGLPEIVRKSQKELEAAREKQKKASGNKVPFTELIKDPQELAKRASKMSLSKIPAFADFKKNQHRNRVKNQHRDKQVSRQEGYLRALEDARKGGVEYYDRPPK